MRLEHKLGQFIVFLGRIYIPVFVFFLHMNKSLFILVLISFIFLVVVGCSRSPDPSFAQCLTEKDVTMFGAYWCSHCATQKKLFGNSWQYVNYVECSLPNKAGTTEICLQEKIETFPTWDFADGNRVEGVLTIEQLSVKTGCLLQ